MRSLPMTSHASWRRCVVAGAVALLALFLALSLAPRPAHGQRELPSRLVYPAVERGAAQGLPLLRTSAGPDPDTVWVGHVKYPTPNNPWNIGRGRARPTVSPANDSIAIWDWDNYVMSGPDQESDSLMGWWPIRRAYDIVSGVLPDNSRPWMALDFGNQANYVINQGLGRTFGVCGVWHRDRGANEGSLVPWLPISGAASAWCGLRVHGDNVEVEGTGTANPFTQDCLQLNGVNSPLAGGTSQGFPGYAGQWDQMLYRDVALGDGASLSLSFKYSTSMSTTWDTDPATKTGWFDKDPLSLAAGNFISATNAGAAAPRDSFMVYIGVPVNESACVRSDGSTAPVYDVQRRWFSEVIRVNEPGAPYHRLMGAAGISGSTALPITFSTTISNSVIQPMLDAQPGAGGRIRIVFRVKTNRGFDDGDAGENGYSSGGNGAALIDDVVANGTTIGDFEDPLSIDNLESVSATAAWKSTGKPPAVFFHVADVRTLSYNELCGAWDSPARSCNIYNNIISAGDVDNNEAAGGTFATAEQEREDGIVSPTIDLTDGPSGGLNEMGLRKSVADVQDDIYLRYDVFAGIFNLLFTGDAWVFGFQSYPAQQASNSVPCWSELRVPDFQFFQPEPSCITDMEPAYRYGLIRTSNADGIPDSLRVFLGKNQQCFRFAISAGCSPTDGCYFDNVSLGFVDGTGNQPNAAALHVEPWEWINDTFPFTDDDAVLATADFDTCAALIKTGLNTYPTTLSAWRPVVPGDTTVVQARGSNVRIDLVFRIEPGPGNYVRIGDTSSGLRKVPTSTVRATAGDGTFFGQYMLASSSPFGKGTHPPGDHWDRNVWNSSRCDTSENNLFPIPGKGGQPTIGRYCSQRHEADVNFTTLGITKNRCFLNDTNGTAMDPNVNCTTVPAWAQDPAIALRAGYDGVQTTKEYTKILPDGMFTPGTHVEYFYRSGGAPSGALIALAPDTNFIAPQTGEGSNTDGHRWQEFSVLPDRWKDPSFHHAGLGMACMLVVDLDDGRGDERVWVSVADSIGATEHAKWGAHNGWHAMNNQVYMGVNVGLDDGICVRTHGGQPGTMWDMYNVKAAESLTARAGALGSRLAPAPGGAAAGKASKLGPTLKMLKTYYRMIMIFTGDLNSGILGPYLDYGPDDLGLLRGFLRSGSLGNEKLLYIQGDGFAQSETQTGGILSAHKTFMTDFLGMELRNISYANESGNLNDVADLIPTNVITSNGDVYGIRNTCVWSNDVLKKVATVSEATEADFYEPVGPTPPYVSGVYKPSAALRPWITLVDGWDLRHLTGRYDVSGVGRLEYMHNMLTNVFGSMCAVDGCPEYGCGSMDTPQRPRGAVLMDFMRLESENPVSGRTARLAFGLASSGRVEVAVFDVAGRRVRLLASRVFPAGEKHVLTWDGTDDAGHRLARGVYFWQVHSPAFTSTRKVIFLR